MQLHSSTGLGRALEKFRPLCGKRLALLEADGFELARLTNLREAFELAGAEVVLLAPLPELRAFGTGVTLTADLSLSQARAEVFHALGIPGAPSAIEHLRRCPEALELVRHFSSSGKWIATLDHGLLLLDDAGVTAGTTVASAAALRSEVEQAGAVWTPEAVIAHRRLVTAQGDAQLEAFLRVASLSFQEKRSEPPPGYH
jgi:protease I